MRLDSRAKYYSNITSVIEYGYISSVCVCSVCIEVLQEMHSNGFVYLVHQWSIFI